VAAAVLLGDGPMDLFPKGLPGAQNHIDHDKGLDEEDYHENRGAPGANYKRQCRASKPRQDSVQPVLRIVLGHCDEVGKKVTMAEIQATGKSQRTFRPKSLATRKRVHVRKRSQLATLCGTTVILSTLQSRDRANVELSHSPH